MAPAATVYLPGRSASRHDARVSFVSEYANGWPFKMTVMGRGVGAAVAAARAGKQYRKRPLMKWKRPTHDVSVCAPAAH